MIPTATGICISLMLTYVMDTNMEKRLAVANDLRESENYGESAKAYTDCLIDLVEENDPTGLIHCLGGQSLIYKNLLTVTDSPLYRGLTLSFAKIGLDLAEQNLANLDGRILSIAYSCYADALLTNDQAKDALGYFEKSLAVSPAEIPEKSRLKAHIAGINYFLGNKELGQEMMHESLAEVRTGDLENSTIRTWETGILNGLAMLYAKENKPDQALSYAHESQSIAEKYSLPIRKRQIEDIIKKITSGQTNFSI